MAVFHCPRCDFSIAPDSTGHCPLCGGLLIDPVELARREKQEIETETALWRRLVSAERRRSFILLWTLAGTVGVTLATMSYIALPALSLGFLASMTPFYFTLLGILVGLGQWGALRVIRSDAATPLWPLATVLAWVAVGTAFHIFEIGTIAGLPERFLVGAAIGAFVGIVQWLGGAISIPRAWLLLPVASTLQYACLFGLSYWLQSDLYWHYVGADFVASAAGSTLAAVTIAFFIPVRIPG